MHNTFIEHFNLFPNRIIIPKSPCDWKQQFCNGNVTATLNIAFTTKNCNNRCSQMPAVMNQCRGRRRARGLCRCLCGIGRQECLTNTGVNRWQWGKHAGINLTFYTLGLLCYLQLPLCQLDKIMKIQRQVEKKERNKSDFLTFTLVMRTKESRS